MLLKWLLKSYGRVLPRCTLQQNFKASSRELLQSPPIPELSDTLAKYLNYVQVLCDQKTFEKVKRDLDDFAAREGPEIQKELKQVALMEKNWINPFWIKAMYLGNRAPLPVYSSPGFALEPVVHHSSEDYFRYAARFIHGVFDFKSLLDKKAIASERSTGRIKPQQLSMNQFWDIFSSYRLPNYRVDTLEVQERAVEPADEHIIVMYSRMPFLLPVVLKGKIKSLKELSDDLAHIVELADAENDNNVLPIGAFTTANRDEAAFAYKLLERDETNKKSLEAIKRCAFVLCLDEASSGPETDDPKERCLVHMITGGGPKHSLFNRWFHKTFQFILTFDGWVGVTYEHTVADGAPMFMVMEHVAEFTANEKELCDTLEAAKAAPSRLQWRLDEDTKEMIKSSMEKARFTEELDMKILEYTIYGKNYPKSMQMSPDAFVQLTLQWACYRLHGRPFCTYESASMRRFVNGRIENLRAATPQALKWVVAMENKSASMVKFMHLLKSAGITWATESKRRDFLEAMSYHCRIMQEVLTGYGIDNHLIALKDIAEQKYEKLPNFFTNRQFDSMFNFRLSTSQLPWLLPNRVVGYGPVVEDGYGCAYKLSEESITFYISSMKSCKETNASRFRDTLRKTLDDMKTFTETICPS